MSITSTAENNTCETDHGTRKPLRRFRTGIAAVALGITALFVAAACEPATPQQSVEMFWKDLTPCANRIIQRESGWNPAAVSPGGGNIGLFQLNAYHKTWIRNELGFTWEDLKKPTLNAAAAKVLYDKAVAQYGDGWQPWRLSGRAIRGGGCPA